MAAVCGAGIAAGAPAPAAPAAEVRPPALKPLPELPVNDRDLLTLDDEMRQFFAARIDAEATQETRLNQIMAALLGEQGLHLSYAADANLSARDTFHQRRGNCLSFALLTVAVARTYRLTAKFCEINTYPRWDRYGNVVTEIRHLNVQIRAGVNRYELDLLPVVERQAPVASAKVVSDARAFAHFYNNLGVFRVADGALAEAQMLFDRAIAADSTAAFVWANKGSALRLAGNPAAAQGYLERAVREDPRDLSALSSLANHYTQTGQTKLAAELGSKVERYRMRNPYYLGLLARSEYNHARYREADKLLRRAIAIKDDEPEFYELRILVAQGLGRTSDVQRWTNKLQALRSPPKPPPAGS
jgi:Tfp pilus assembly protein PilF